MDDITSIRTETLVRIEVNALLDALTRGDFAEAAEAQARPKGLGWYITREAPRPRSHKAARRQGVAHV
jgi:hypothetical protein